MNLSAPFIKRPVATILITVAIALAGAAGFSVLPMSPLPQIDFPTISVQAQLPGASPEIMASSVATPLERQFGHIAGISEMTSSSTLGSTNITMQFDLDRDINGAARDVEAAINAARTFLPSNLPANPFYRKVNPADAPIFILALTSKAYDRGPMYDAASTIMQQRLSQISGVGQVVVGGSSLPSVRVEVNPTQLNSYGLGLPDVASVLSSQNSNRPKGQLSNGLTSANIVDNDQLLKAVDYKPLVVAYRNGHPILLSDVANVVDDVQNIRSAGYMNGLPAILIIIFRAPGANIIATVDRIKEALPSLKASIPQAMDITTVLDRTTTIRASVKDVERSLLISIALVILVVFLFLRNWRVTFIPSVAVPVSLIGTFGVMYLCNYSLDNLSLMALTISTGFVVDDAIVVIENISRYIEKGMAPMEAAFKGAQEIGFTVLTISASLIAVFTPILLMGGIVGRLFREFAVTLSVAIFVSMIISLTTTPMLCSRLLKSKKETKPGRFYQASEKFFDTILGFYQRTLKVVLRHPMITLGVLAITIALNFVLFIKVPKGFFPEQDNGTVFGGIQGAQDISFQHLNHLTQDFVKKIKEDPAVDHVMAFLGGNGATNSGFMYLGLTPLEDRKINSSQVINRLRPKLFSVPGASVFLQAGQDLRIGGRQSNAQYQYTIQSENIDDLVKWGPTLLKEMKGLHGLTDVNSDQQNSGLRSALTYDRSTAARLGISPQLIDQTLYDAFGQAPVSTMYTALNQYFVVMESAPKFDQAPSGLDDVYIHTSTGTMVPLSTVVHSTATSSPLAVNHQGQFPSVTVSFNLAPNVSLSDASQRIVDLEKSLGMPSSIKGMFSGTLQSFKDSLSTEPLLVLLALIAVYIVLGILYESYIHPITILSTLPSAGIGAVLALLLFRLDLSVVALIGVILLIGIVKKNAILMIDFALAAEREEHMKPIDAIFKACMLRFRPIMMTTMAALFGAMPLAFGGGVGSELRRPLGVSIIGGLLISQILTLYTTPVVYLSLDRLRLWVKKHRKHAALVTVKTTLSLLALILCGACTSMAPKYEVPKVAMPNKWKQAQPADNTLRGKWWEIYGDVDLNALEERVIVNNQNIAAAFAGFNAARAAVKIANSQFFPTVAVAPSGTAQQAPYLPNTSPVQYTSYQVPLQASWAPDLFGRIRATVNQSQAQYQISDADLENEKLVEQVDLATYYFELRGQDVLKVLFEKTNEANKASLKLTQDLFKTGIDNAEAVAQAETQLETVEAQTTNLELARAQYEHAIALLVGEPASSFAITPRTTNQMVFPVPPAIPAGVPSDLLQRRPDIAAAERAVAAANEQIGVSKSAFFPSLALTGSAGYQAYSFSSLLNAPSFIWSLGATLSETIFNGGQREATMEQSRYLYDQTVANYRQVVLTGFQQVEDALSGLDILKRETDQYDLAIKSSERYLKIATDRFRTGLDPYLNVLTAQVTLITNQQAAMNLRIQLMSASVQLIEALGGGWDRSSMDQLIGERRSK